MKKITLFIITCFICLGTSMSLFAQTTNGAYIRKYVFEEFSTEACPNCPPVATTIHNLKVADPNLIVMVQHAGYNTDKFTIQENKDMLVLYNSGGATYAPAGMIDRYYLGATDFDNYDGVDKGPVLFPSGTIAKKMIDKRKQVSPTSDVSVNITGSYNASTKQITAIVSGNFSANFTNVGVSLWIVEDNIASTTQASGGSSWVHHDVVRDAISNQWGDPLTGTTSGGAYTKTYTYTVPSTWVVANLNLVAFVNQIDAGTTATAINNRTIYNAEEVVLSNLTTGIKKDNSINRLSVYPNPSNGIFSTVFEAISSDNYSVKITNTLGQVVYQELLNNFSGVYSKEINLTSYGQGIYMLVISNSKQEEVKKVLNY
jgi:hypothetical protein